MMLQRWHFSGSRRSTVGKGFTNHEQTDPSGLIYMQARMYAPVYGRFLSPDPARDQHFEQTQSWNIYSYVQNDPTMKIDPTGMVPQDPNAGRNSEWTYDPILAAKIGLPLRTTPGLDRAYTGLGYIGVAAAGTLSGGMVAEAAAPAVGTVTADALGGATAGTVTRALTGNKVSAASVAIDATPGVAAGAIFRKVVGLFSAKPPVGAVKETTVIGRVKDLQKLNPGERSLLSRLPNQGSPQANWEQNAGVLRQEMGRGLPIRDASPGDTSGQFLNAERNLLKDRGWTFDSRTNFWNPPVNK